MTTINRFMERPGGMWTDFKVFQGCASVEPYRELILKQTGSIPKSELSPILHVGDRAIGTTVLSDLYQHWKDAPVNVNLDQLWGELGMRLGPHGIELDSDAPLAEIRSAITARPLH
jgi:hypothetical protein